jgi:hypothetical protein
MLIILLIILNMLYFRFNDVYNSYVNNMYKYIYIYICIKYNKYIENIKYNIYKCIYKFKYVYRI